MNDNVVGLNGEPIQRDNVVELDVATFAEIPPTQILEQAKEAEMESVVVLGWKRSGEFYFASSQSSVSEINLMLDVCKHTLMEELRGE